MDRKLVENVQRLRKEGKSFGDISKELLITKSQACYCNKINIEECDKKLASRDKYAKSVCKLAEKCTNINQILHILGKKGTNEYYKQIRKILEDNNIDTSHFIENETHKQTQYIPKKSLEECLISGSTVSSTRIRDRLLKEKVKEHICERCGKTEWEGEPIPLQLHHINGDRTDNRLENLQMLCPNCHTLTDNYCGKKLKKEEKHCIICGKIINRGSTYCFSCFNKYIKEKTKNGFIKDEFKNNQNEIVKHPTKEELIDTFKIFGSFRGVARKYGVSDKAIVKWCIKYDLPTHALEMRKYLRENFGEKLKWKFSEGNKEILTKYQKEKFKKICLLDDNGKTEKIYSNKEEIIDDSYDYKSVYKVCVGETWTHRNRKFKFLEDD